MLAEVQGSITFPLQQMPHAISISRITTLESRDEQLQWLGARRSRWVILDFDGVIGANKVLRNLSASWIMNKRDLVSLIHPIQDVKRNRVAQISNLAVSLK